MALIVGLPPGGATWRKFGGANAWTGGEHMLAAIDTGIRVLAWMKTKDATNGRNMPEPTLPPETLPERRRHKETFEKRRAEYQARQTSRRPTTK